MTYAQGEVGVRAAVRARQIAAAVTVERTLTTQHLMEFAPTVRQVVPMPAAPGPAEVAARREEFSRRATARIGLFRRTARRRARETAVRKADDLLRRRQVRAVIDAQRCQVDGDEIWAAVREHDPTIVVDLVAGALADLVNEASCVDAGHDEITGTRHVTSIVVVGAVDAIVPSWPASTFGTKAAQRGRGEVDRHEVYARAIASSVLAVAKKSLAVASAADEVRVLAVRVDDESAAGVDGLGAVYAGSFRRTDLADLDWPAIDPVEVLLSAGGARLVRKGRVMAVATVVIDDERQLELLAEFAGRVRDAADAPPKAVKP